MVGAGAVRRRGRTGGVVGDAGWRVLDHQRSGRCGRPDRQWQDMLSATHLPWTVQVDPCDDERPFEAWVRRWWIDDLALVDCECSPCSGTRQRRQLADTDGEFVVVLMTRAGSETVSQGDVETAMRPGDAV